MTVWKSFNLFLPQFLHLGKQRVLSSNICTWDICTFKWFLPGSDCCKGDRMVCTSENLRRRTLRHYRTCCSNSHRPLRGRAWEVWHRDTGRQDQWGKRAVRTSGGTGLWELGKTQPELCFPCFCQRSGESQLSSIIRAIEGRNYRIKMKWSTMIGTRPEGSKGRWKRKEIMSVGLSPS